MSVHRFLLALSATVLLAQTTQLGPGVAAVKSALGLSDQQVQQLVQLRKDEQQALQPTREKMREKRQALMTERQAANPNPTAIGQLVIDIQGLQKQIQTANQASHVQALAVLDDAQKAKLKELDQTARTERAAIRGAEMLNLLLMPAQGRGPGRGMMP